MYIFKHLGADYEQSAICRFIGAFVITLPYCLSHVRTFHLKPKSSILTQNVGVFDFKIRVYCLEIHGNTLNNADKDTCLEEKTMAIRL